MNLPIFKSRYFWFAVAFAFIYKIIAVVIYHFYPQHLSYVWSEGNLGENIAAAAWGLGAILCLIKLFFFMGEKDIWLMWIWCFLAFFLGVTRELDMHKKMDEISGITWKSEFLNDPGVSVALKVALIAIMATIAIVMFGSLIYKHRSIIREINAGNVMVTLVVMGMVYMSSGFLLDGSVLGNKLFFGIISRSFSKLCEESFETIAACVFLIAVLPYFFRKNALPMHK